MKSNNIISIFVVGDNNCENLRKLFDSLLDQTSNDFEIIFRDNNSKDDSFETAIQYSVAFKKKNIFMSVYRNKETMDMSDTNNNMMKESEGMFFCYLYPVVSLKPNYVERILNIMNCQKYGALICSDSLTYIKEEGVIDNRTLIKEIIDGNIEYNQIVFNRMCNVIFSNNAEIFLDNDHLYRLFISAMCREVYYLKKDLIKEYSNNLNEKNYDNLMVLIEKYRLIIAINRKLAIFGKTDLSLENEFIRAALTRKAKELSEIMKKQNKIDVAKKYIQLSKVFEII